MQVSTPITETPGVSGGYPCIGDTRIRVGLVIEVYRETGDVDRTADLFDLAPADVYAALDYYEGHRERVDEDIRRNRREERGV